MVWKSQKRISKQKDVIESTIAQLGCSADIDDINDVVSKAFNNARNLQLTRYGFLLLRQTTNTYEISFPKNFTLRPSHLIYISRYLTEPFYITPKKLIMFDERDSFEMLLFNDLDAYVNAKKTKEKALKSCKK